MKMKTKKILSRLFAVLATLLLVVAMALPCFADATYYDDTYCLQVAEFTDATSLYNFIQEYGTSILFVQIINPSDHSLDGSRLFANSYIGEQIFCFSGGQYNDNNASIISATMSVYETEIVLDMSAQIIVDRGADYDAEVNYSGFTTYLDDATMAEDNITIVVVCLSPFEITPAPIDPDAPTRTGLYGELYHIIRDAIYGENALLDSTQEFTLTQISTWMTYIVILLPLVVIGIILFKIFVR